MYKNINFKQLEVIYFNKIKATFFLQEIKYCNNN